MLSYFIHPFVPFLLFFFFSSLPSDEISNAITADCETVHRGREGEMKISLWYIVSVAFNRIRVMRISSSLLLFSRRLFLDRCTYYFHSSNNNKPRRRCNNLSRGFSKNIANSFLSQIKIYKRNDDKSLLLYITLSINPVQINFFCNKKEIIRSILSKCSKMKSVIS